MKYYITAFFLLIASVFSSVAQTTDQTSVSGSDANSLSGSISAVTINSGPTGGGGKTKTDFNTVPDVVSPGLAGGNPCAISASFGGSVMGFGITGGVGSEGPKCENRQEVALMANMGYTNAAMVHFCLHNSDVEETMKLLGKTCMDAADAKANGNQFPASGAISIVNAVQPVGKVAPVPKPSNLDRMVSANCRIGDDGFCWSGSGRER